jgi:hypothetical protein
MLADLTCLTSLLVDNVSLFAAPPWVVPLLITGPSELPLISTSGKLLGGIQDTWL